MAKKGRSSAANKARAGASAAKAKAKAAAGSTAGRSERFEEVSWKRSGLIDGTKSGSMPWNPDGTRWWKSHWGWLAPLLAIAFLIPAFLFAFDHIEDDIQDAGSQILAQERPDIDQSNLTFDATYRNIEVGGVLPTGIVAEDIERALEDNNWDFDGEDVRNVTVTAEAAPAQQFAAIDVDVMSDGDTITLTGLVPSEDNRLELVAAAEETGLMVDDRLTVAGLEPSADDADGQIGRMSAVIGGLGIGTFATANLALGDDGPVTGQITALDAGGANTFTGLVSSESVDVSAPQELAPLDANVTYDGDRIVLDGTVFSEEERASLASAAADVVGEGNVVNNLEISELDAAVEGSSDRVNAFATAIGTFDGLDSADGSLNDTDLTINGVARDDATQAATRGALEASASADLRPGGEITVPEGPSLDEEVDLLQAELDALQDEIRENVVFASNSAELTPLAQGTLDKVASAMTRFARPVVQVSGHTDSMGAPDFNIDLSQRRTDSVVAYLTDQGIALERLMAVGIGEADPIADNLTEEGRLMNRRVEFLARPSFDG